MDASVQVAGVGHAVGSQEVSNADLARRLDLNPDWFASRTGIERRRVCAPGEDVQTLAEAAVRRACESAGLALAELGPETVLLHIQNGMVCLTPPSGILLAQALGLNSVRALAIDGVCAEPIAALELAVLLLTARRCERVIVSASADFVDAIDPRDLATAGLFGAGAGAAVLTLPQADAPSARIESLYWQTDSRHADLGRIPILAHEVTENGVRIDTGFYAMDGQGLARVALRVLPGVLAAVLAESGWTRDQVGLVIAHQPNVKLLDIGMRVLGLNPTTVPTPVRYLGNMGPASLLVNLSLAKDAGLLMSGIKVLLVAFGLGFSCGAAAVAW